MVSKFLLRTFIFSLFSVGSGCLVYNSSSQDAIRHGGDGSAFSNVRVVLATRCSRCHQYHIQSAAQLAAAKLVVFGDLASSPLYSHLRGSRVGGAEDMPPDSVLTKEELDILANWIEEFN